MSLTITFAKTNRENKIDPKRVYVIGHSNGGFMAHRLACDASEQITAIASLAGATFYDQSKCDPKKPVSIIEIHALNDKTVRYDGNYDEIKANPDKPHKYPESQVVYPAALETIESWIK